MCYESFIAIYIKFMNNWTYSTQIQMKPNLTLELATLNII